MCPKSRKSAWQKKAPGSPVPIISTGQITIIILFKIRKIEWSLISNQPEMEDRVIFLKKSYPLNIFKNIWFKSNFVLYETLEAVL